jgi:thiamine pyrophosphokinase
MHGMLFIGGDAPSRKTLETLLENTDLVVGADSGIDTARTMGLMPHLFVGDMDSIADRAVLRSLPDERVRIYPQEKDETDTEIGLRVLREAGCDEITIVGGGGGRADHFIGILSLFARPHPPDRWLTRREQLRFVRDSLTIRGLRGRILSVFPVGPQITLATSEGLRWPLDGLVWSVGDVGISNVVDAEVLRIHVRSGAVLVVHEYPLGSEP